MRLNRYAHIVRYNNKTIILNKCTGFWLYFPEEILSEIENFPNRTENEILNEYDEESRKIIEKAFANLKQLGVLGDAENPFNLKEISIALTHRCNLNCKHCIVSAGTLKDQEIFSTSDMKKILDKIITLYPESITLTGGEALVRKDFEELVKYIRLSYQGHLSLMTNGVLISNRNIELLVNFFDDINISIDGIDEESCSLIRGKGVFDKVVNAVKLLKERNFNNITLSMVLTKNNECLVNEFYELNSKLGTEPMLRCLMLEGRAETNEKLLTETKIQEGSIPKSKKVSKFRMPACGCMGEAVQLTIDEKGNIYPCDLFTHDEFSLGNITQIENITEWIKSINYLKEEALKDYDPYNDVVISKCADCPVKVFCWKCPYSLYKCSKNKIALEEHCSTYRNFLMDTIWGEEG